jgi:hypothetical protein
LSDTGAHEKAGGSFLRKLIDVFEKGGHETGPDTHSGKGLTASDLSDIQGFVLRGYRMPIVRHFLLTAGVPAQARKLLARLVSGDESDAPQVTTAENGHVGFEPGPGDNPADVSRCKPDYCLNVAITWLGLTALEIKDRVPGLSFRWFDAFTARHQPGSPYNIQQPARSCICGRRCLSGNLARRWHGAD